MTVVDVLVAGRDLITLHHTTGAIARDWAGRRVKPRHPAATCWCAVGALLKVAPSPTSLERGGTGLNADGNRALLLLEKAANERGHSSNSVSSAAWLNDELGQEGAIGMYGRALELAKQGPADTGQDTEGSNT